MKGTESKGIIRREDTVSSRDVDIIIINLLSAHQEEFLKSFTCISEFSQPFSKVHAVMSLSVIILNLQIRKLRLRRSSRLRQSQDANLGKLSVGHRGLPVGAWRSRNN